MALHHESRRERETPTRRSARRGLPYQTASAATNPRIGCHDALYTLGLSAPILWHVATHVMPLRAAWRLLRLAHISITSGLLHSISLNLPHQTHISSSLPNHNLNPKRPPRVSCRSARSGDPCLWLTPPKCHRSTQTIHSPGSSWPSAPRSPSGGSRVSPSVSLFPPWPSPTPR